MNKKKHKQADKTDLKVLAERLIALLENNPKQAYGVKGLQKKLNLQKPKQRAEFEVLLASLAQKGLIKKVGENSYQAIMVEAPMVEYVGRVDFVNREYAFIVIPDVKDDMRVISKNLKQALDGDTVKVGSLGVGKSGRMEGVVLEVLERARTEFVGKIQISGRYAFVVADQRKMYYDIFVRLGDSKKAKNGDKVIVELTSWDEAGKSPVGKVKTVLGKAGEHNTEMNSIMAEFGLPVHFPKDVENESEAISEMISEEEIAKRRDFRNVLTFTIDPQDAKDFDDALSIRKLENGNWEIGVHIADVTHYVRPNTALETEAFKRATSVYLVDRVIPMLPERLSNNICSLRPNEDKLTFSAVFELTPRVKIVNEWFGRTIINSDRRFSYEDAQEKIESKKGEYAEEILTLNHLAKLLQKKRFRAGAIAFESIEVKFKLDENGKPLELVQKVRKDAHKLIEEFMLLANKQVAEFVFNMKKGKTKNTMVYRIHDEPDLEKLADFKIFAKRFGYNLDLEDEKKLSFSLNSLSQAVEGKPEQNVIQSLAIRTMAKAKYSTMAMGHFGLAFKHYSHFTSPIRRYPDMMAHRLLDHYLKQGESTNPVEWEKRCQHSSDMEKRAADAERASVKYKQVEFMQANSQPNMAGIITGLTEWGMYVEVSATKCEGMVRLSDMEDDHYELDAKKYRIVGKKHHKTYTMGDQVTVNLKSVNLEKRIIDLVLSEE